VSTLVHHNNTITNLSILNGRSNNGLSSIPDPYKNKMRGNATILKVVGSTTDEENEYNSMCVILPAALWNRGLLSL
jgi:hypothetical protein